MRELSYLKNIDQIRNRISEQLEELCFFNLINQKNVYLSNIDKVDSSTEKLFQISPFKKELVPVKIIGDGNCLYRSLSKSLYGREDHHYELRYRIAIEMVLKRDSFLQCTRNEYSNETNFFDHLCPESDSSIATPESIFDQQILSAIRINEFASVWHIYSAAQALNINIYQNYPSLESNSQTNMINFMNRKIDNLDGVAQGIINIFNRF